MFTGENRTLFIAATIGLLIGLLVALDPLFMVASGVPYPYLMAPFVIAALAVMFLVRKNQATLYQHRDAIFLFFLFLGFHTTAIQSGLDLGEVMILVILPLTILEFLSRNGRNFAITPLLFFAVLFFIVVVLSLAKSFDPLSVRKEVKALIIYFLIFTYLYWHNSPSYMIRLWIVITTMSCMLVFFQEGYYVYTGEVFVGSIAEDSLNRMYEDTMLGPMFRTPGFTNGYRELALLLSLSIAFLVSTIIDPVAKTKKTTIIILLIHVAAISLTFAKDLITGLSIAIFIVWAMLNKSKLIWLAMMTAFGGAAVILLVAYDAGGYMTYVDMLHQIPSMEKDRVQLNRAAIEGLVWNGDYFIGAGMSQTDSYTDHYLGWKAHNAFILVTNAAGIPGLLALLSLYGWVAYRLWCINAVARQTSDIVLVRALGIFFITEFFGAQFTSGFTENVFWLHAAMVEVTAIRLLYKEDRDDVMAGDSTPIKVNNAM